VRQEPFSLPEGFKWDTLQLDDPLVLKEVFFIFYITIV
jgi:glycylpeptide N-tetradecanoyltransferase